jgi:hypothetical protein
MADVASVPDHDLRRRFEGQLNKFTNVVKGWQFRYRITHLRFFLILFFVLQCEYMDSSVADPKCFFSRSDLLIILGFKSRSGFGFGVFSKVHLTFLCPAKPLSALEE